MLSSIIWIIVHAFEVNKYLKIKIVNKRLALPLGDRLRIIIILIEPNLYGSKGILVIGGKSREQGRLRSTPSILEGEKENEIGYLS